MIDAKVRAYLKTKQQEMDDSYTKNHPNKLRTIGDSIYLPGVSLINTTTIPGTTSRLNLCRNETVDGLSVFVCNGLSSLLYNSKYSMSIWNDGFYSPSLTDNDIVTAF